MPSSVLVPGVSEPSDRHALQVKPDTLADFTNSRTRQTGTVLVESSTEVWQRSDRRIDELIHRPEQAGVNGVLEQSFLVRSECDLLAAYVL